MEEEFNKNYISNPNLCPQDEVVHSVGKVENKGESVSTLVGIKRRS